MKNSQRFSIIGLILLSTAIGGFAQEHRWAGRALDQLEWTIHDKLAALPSHGVFDTVRFELDGDSVTLTGQVLKESAKDSIDLAVRNVEGVRGVVNKIEVLPSSRKDDALRMHVYKAIYKSEELEKYELRASPSIHIIVSGGWVRLEGVVDSEEDRHTALLKALKVTSHVLDNLRVAPEASRGF